jgi:hypothetical protein
VSAVAPALNEVSLLRVGRVLRAGVGMKAPLDAVRVKFVFETGDDSWARISDQECLALMHRGIELADEEAADGVRIAHMPLSAAAGAIQRSALPSVWLEDAVLPATARGHVKGLLGDGDLGLIYGGPGTGKTFLAIDLVGHIALGLPWRGRRTSGRPVVYVAAEAGRSIQRRFVPWRERHAGDAREGRVPLKIITRAVNLLLPGELGELLAELRAVRDELGEAPGVVVFDTLSRSMAGGDENSSESMTAVVGAADRVRTSSGARA